MEAKGAVRKLSTRGLRWNARWMVIRNRQALIANSIMTLPKRRLSLQNCRVRPLPPDEMPWRLRRSFAFILVPSVDEEGCKPLIFSAASEPELGAWLGALAAAGALVPLVALPSPCLDPSPEQAGTVENSCISHHSHVSQHSHKSHHSRVSLDSCRSLCSAIKAAWNRDSSKMSRHVSDMPISVGAVSLSSCRSLLDAIRGNTPEYLPDTSLAPVEEWNSESGSRTSSPKRPRHTERSAHDEIAMIKSESPKRLRHTQSKISSEIENASQQTACPGKTKRNCHEEKRNLSAPSLYNSVSSRSRPVKSASVPSLKSNSDPQITKAKEYEHSVVSHASKRTGESETGQSIPAKAEMDLQFLATRAVSEVRFQISQHHADEDTATVNEHDQESTAIGARLTRRCPLQTYIDEIECHAPPLLQGHHAKSMLDPLSNSWNRVRHGLNHSITRKDPTAIKYWRDAKTKRRLCTRRTIITRGSSSQKLQNGGSADVSEAENGRLVH